MSKNKEKKAGKRMKKTELVNMINNFFVSQPVDESFSLKKICTILRLTTHPLKRLCFDILEELTYEGFLKKVSSNEYLLNNRGQVLKGTFQRKNN